MKENKNNEVVKYLLENYDIKNANDIADALKDIFFIMVCKILLKN